MTPTGWMKTLTFAGALALSAVAAKAESLTDTLITAYRHSHILDQQRALLRAADEDVASSMAALRPVIDFVATLAARNTATFTSPPWDVTGTLAITAQITLFDNGQSKLATEAAKETVLATREALVNFEQQVLLNAVQAYFGVVSAAETVQLRRSNVRLIRQELRAARDRFEVGEVTRTDVAQAESRLALARSQEAAALGDFEVSRESFRAAVGRYPKLPLVANPPLPAVPGSVKKARAVAVRSHPQIRQVQREVTASELNIQRAEAAKKFTVTGSGSYSLQNDADEVASLQLQLRQPIYRGGSLTSAVRAARAQRDAIRASLLNTVHTIEQQVGTAWANLAVAQAQISATDRQIAAAQIAFRGVQEEFGLGESTTLEVLDAEQELLDARVNRVTAQTNRHVALYQLLSAMGLLTVDHLRLGIQTYDPALYFNAVKNAPVKRSKQGRQLDSVLKRLNLD